MSVLDDLKQETAQDMERARARLAAIEAVAYAAGQLRAAGFAAEVARDGVGMVTLRFDPDGGGAVEVLPPAPVIDFLQPRGEDSGEADAVPDPDPEPDAAPKPKPTTGLRRPAPKPKADPELITGPIEGEEREVALEMLAAGTGPAVVARQLGRKAKQLSNLKQKNKARIAEIQAAATGGSGLPDAMTGAERTIDAHLNALGYADPWSAGKDLALVEGLCRGANAAEIAAELGVERNNLVTRYKAINTDRGDIDHQKRLLRVLRARAG